MPLSQRDMQTCSYCGEEFPTPVELHHAEAECLRPHPGESWKHKGAGVVVTIIDNRPGDPDERVRWINQLGREGKDTLGPFLKRFEKIPDLMAALKGSLKR